MTRQQSSSSGTSAFEMSADTSSSSGAGQSFSSYLTSVSSEVQKTLVNEEQQRKDGLGFINIIMGNEAGDADSIISSLALSYVKTMEKRYVGKLNSSTQDEKETVATFTNDSTKFVPVISINREDMPLRRDVVQLLRMAGIYNYEELVYLDDPWSLSIMKESNNHASKNGVDDVEEERIIALSLVDHNKIRSNLWHLEQYVEEIFDHHQDENFHTKSVTTREVAFLGQKALVGSTCTIIVERIKKMSQTNLDAGLGISLLGVILLDTMNMNPEASKGTERDEAAIEYLMKNSDWDLLDNETKEKIVTDRNEESTVVPDRSKLYEYLCDSKFDRIFWREMSPRDAMRIDYKRFEPKSEKDDGVSNKTFGLSSVLLGLDEMMAKKDFFRTIVKFMNEVNVDMLGVMCMVIVDDRPKRELLLIGDSTVEGLAVYLLSDSATKFLDISIVEDVTIEAQQNALDGLKMKRFRQGNPKGSRKQLAPLILSFLSS